MTRSTAPRASFTYRRRLGAGATGIAAGAASSGAMLATAGISAGVQLAIAGTSMWLNSIQQSHNANTATTLIVNGLAQQLANLNAAYFAEKNRTCADQRAALNAYDEAWLWLQSPAACGAPNYGRAGNACIEERSPGGKFPWKTYYRDPIANDSAVSGCDTGETVFLPSMQSGQYQQAGITSTGGSASGYTAAPASSPAAAPAAAIVQGIPNEYLLIGAAAVVLLLVTNK